MGILENVEVAKAVEAEPLLQRLIASALQTWRAERDKHDAPTDPLPSRAFWPYEKSEKVEAQASRELSTHAKSRRQLVERLQRFRYPYQSRAKKAPTFYFHVKKLRLLTFLQSRAFLSEVRMAWSFRRSYELEKELFDRRYCQYCEEASSSGAAVLGV